MGKDENSLVSKVKTGDIDAFEILMTRYVRTVKSFIGFHLPIEDCIEEVCQNTFITAFRKIDSFKKGSFQAWIITIAKLPLCQHLLQCPVQNQNTMLMHLL